MPKIVTEQEKIMMRNAMHQQGIRLIREKGITHITVDDMIDAVEIAKGTFYKYYPSKDELLYEIVRQAEEKMLTKVLSVDYEKGNFRDNVSKMLKKIYLAPDSIALYVTPEEVEYLADKTSGCGQNDPLVKKQSNFDRTAKLFGLKEDDETRGVLSYLMDALQFTASCRSVFDDEFRQLALEKMVDTIAAYLSERRRKND